MNELIWLHPDCLAADNPAYLKYPKADALFVFDEDEIDTEQWTLKRIAFLYETLIELPAEIERGHTGLYVLSAEERAAVEIGLKEMQKNRFAKPEEIEALFAKCRS